LWKIGKKLERFQLSKALSANNVLVKPKEELKVGSERLQVGIS
jgi:hypothetical protein